MILLEDSPLKSAEASIEHLLGLRVPKLVCRETHTEQREQKLSSRTHNQGTAVSALSAMLVALFTEGISPESRVTIQFIVYYKTLFKNIFFLDIREGVERD